MRDVHTLGQQAIILATIPRCPLAVLDLLKRLAETPEVQAKSSFYDEPTASLSCLHAVFNSQAPDEAN